MTKRGLLLVAAAIFGAGVLLHQGVTSSRADTDLRRVDLGNHQLLIPNHYLLQGSLLDWVRLIPGLDDDSREILLQFSASELAEGVTGYAPRDGEFEEDVVANLVALTPEELHRYLDSGRFEDLWDRRGEYAGAIIEAHPDIQLFKVYRKMEHPRSWALLSRLPQEGELPPLVTDFWVAHCSSGPSPVTASGSHTSCETFATLGDLMIELNVSEQNLPVIDAIRSFALSKVQQWQAPGASGR